MPDVGIRQRHRRTCGDADSCSCPWEGFVYSKVDRKKIRRTFRTRAAARNWRAEAAVAVRKQTLRAPRPTTLEQAATAWLDGARRG